MRTVSLVLLATLSACVEPPAPPPQLTVTSPERAMIQSQTGSVEVKGTALPGVSGAAVTSVKVNGTQAQLAADGSFSATVDVPAGAMLLETTAIADDGGAATDARAVQVGDLRPVGSNIDRAVTATLSADAFAKLSAAAGPLIMNMNLPQMLAGMQPMENLGDDIANLKLSITQMSLGDVKITLTPVDGGLMFAAELDGIDVSAKADYDGALVPQGSTTIGMTADSITISGTLQVTPNGMNGFTTKIASPSVKTGGLHLQANGLAGDVLGLLDDNLGSTIQDIATTSAQTAMEPLINSAFGALAGPQQIEVMGKKVDLQASPAAVTFTSAGAQVTMNLSANVEGSESSPGFIYTPNGMPQMNMGSGVQLALADDLINEMLAEVYALGLLDINVQQDEGFFDNVEIKMTMPPMVSANTGDGSLRLVLGDMMATFTDHGKPVVSAALNAQVDLAIAPGTNAQDLELQFGKVALFVNALDDGADGSALAGISMTGIGLQLDSLGKFIVTLPLPSIAGVSLDNLAMHSDSGYLVLSGQVH